MARDGPPGTADLPGEDLQQQRLAAAVGAGKQPQSATVVYQELQTGQGLVVVPGSAFSAPGHFRISYAVDEDVLERGLEILKRAL